MAKRGLQRKPRGHGRMRVSISLKHPDFDNVKVDRSKFHRARVAVAQHVTERIVAQIPIRTGQLRQSYRQGSNLGHIGPINTSRWDSRLTNLEVANILSARNYLNITVTKNTERTAVRVAKGILFAGGKPPFQFRGFRVLA